MEYVIGALLLASFFGLAVYAVRGGNLMIGMLIIGTLWTVLPLFGNTFATNPDFIAAYPGKYRQQMQIVIAQHQTYAVA